MSVGVNVGGSWKSMDKAFAKINGSWVQVGGSGSTKIVTYSNYQHPIPVMAGWEYRASTDDAWTVVTDNGTINQSGTFTGKVKVTSSLKLQSYYNTKDDLSMTTASPMVGKGGLGHLGQFVIKDRGFFYSRTYRYKCLNAYDKSGYKLFASTTTGGGISGPCVLIGEKAVVAGGTNSSSGQYGSNKILMYDYEGVETTAPGTIHAGVTNPAGFGLNNKAYICGGYASSTYYDNVSVIDINGNVTVGTPLNDGFSTPFAFSLGDYGYVFDTWDTDNVNIYDKNGNRTIRKTPVVDLPSVTEPYREMDCIFEDKYYLYSGSYVHTFDLNGNASQFNNIQANRGGALVAKDDHIYCFGGDQQSASGQSYAPFYDTIVIIDSVGNMTFGDTKLSTTMTGVAALILPTGEIYVYGAYTSELEPEDSYDCVINPTLVHKFDTVYTTYLPITSGSTYALNGEVVTTDVSGTISITSDKMTGMVEYTEGTISM